MARAERRGKVFVDWSQNDAGKSTVVPYSVRAGSYPTVAAPITWDELAMALTRGGTDTLRFTPDDAVGRVARVGDLFAPVAERAVQGITGP
jgi:bifunctional non-homologous end joining protein LigD